MQVGDEVYIDTLDENLKYEVYNVKIVLPTEIGDLKVQEGEDLLTLITCTPYGINTHRLLVQCKRVENFEKVENKEHFTNFEEIKSKDFKYYFIGAVFGLIIFLLLIICCILPNIIVKYMKKVRNRK